MKEEIDDSISMIKAYVVNTRFDSIDEEIYFQNEIKKILHETSPFKKMNLLIVYSG